MFKAGMPSHVNRKRCIYLRHGRHGLEASIAAFCCDVNVLLHAAYTG